MIRTSLLAFVVVLLAGAARAATPADDARAAKRASIVRGVAIYRKGGLELLPFRPTAAEQALFTTTRASPERTAWMARRAEIDARLAPPKPRGLARLRRNQKAAPATERPEDVRAQLVEGMAKYDLGGIGAILGAFDEITPADRRVFAATRAHYGIPFGD